MDTDKQCICVTIIRISELYLYGRYIQERLVFHFAYAILLSLRQYEFMPLDALNIDSDLFTFLKLRASWAQVGSATGAYSIDPYFTAEASTINGVTQYYQARTYPPATLEPEKVETSE